jgi:hypothetical protein
VSGRIVYEDATITEYDDGTTDVRFTDREWEIMLNDPKFGYVCGGPSKHRMTEGDRRYGGCLSCESEAEAAYYASLPEDDWEALVHPETAVVVAEYDEPF